MSPRAKKKLILSLIKDDLINSKLLRGLNKAGLDADRYCLFLSGTIFDLMAYEKSKRSDRIFSQYLRLTKKGDKIDIRETPNAMNDLAREIYLFLKKNIPSRKK
jgi:hypothetical protein